MPLTHHFRIRDKAPARRSKMHIRLVHFLPIMVSTITARRSSPSSGSGDVARRGFKRIHGLRVGHTSLPVTAQRDETRIGRHFRSELDGFTAIARRRRYLFPLDFEIENFNGHGPQDQCTLETVIYASPSNYSRVKAETT